MTTLPADKLRAMCEAQVAAFKARGCGDDERSIVIARALLELLPAEGEGVDADGFNPIDIARKFPNATDAGAACVTRFCIGSWEPKT